MTSPETQRETSQIVKIGGLEITVRNKRHLSNLQTHEHNLFLAQKAGIKILTYYEILEQIGLENLPYAVFFDTPPDFTHLGNHFRAGSQLLQYCNPFGNFDHERIRPFPIPSMPMFTGVSITTYTDKCDRRVSLYEAQRHSAYYMGPKAYEERIRLKGEQVLFSTQEGILVDASLHPLLQTLFPPNKKRS